MARIRTIKPGFFRHEDLYEAERETGFPLRLAFAGLWTAADREGRFKWSPRQLKLDCLPFDDVDFARVLDALATRGLIVKYASDGVEYGHIPTWHKHQVINNREAASDIPEPNETNTLTRAPRVVDACPTPLTQDQGEGKGREQEGKENISAVAKATRPAEHFEEFWQERPKRKGDDPRKPAEDQFVRLVKSGEDPEIIIAGVKLARIAYAADGKIGTEYVPQMVKWLRDRRYRDFTDASKPPEIVESGFYVKFGSAEQDAWDAYGRAKSGNTFPRDKNGGWRFPTQWPPGYVSRETTDPPEIKLHSMSS